jgi:hypothetical protein
MNKPDFSEYTLQHYVNLSIIQQFVALNNRMPFSYIPSLREEKKWGFDTVFIDPSSIDFSSNIQARSLFLQYKLSNLHLGMDRTNYWGWGIPYFKFRLYNYPRDNSQYDQRRALIRLASRFLVLYASNGVLHLMDLYAMLRLGDLLKETPFFMVDDDMQNHDTVVFNVNRHECFLHSEIKESMMFDLKSNLQEIEPTSLDNDFEYIYNKVLDEEAREAYSRWLHFLSYNRLEKEPLKLLAIKLTLQSEYSICWIRF